jgi:hypothetical protein
MQEQARSKLNNNEYAAMLKGLTNAQLAQEKKSIEHQMRHLPPSSPERRALQQKLDLIGKEQETFQRRVSFASPDQQIQKFQKEYSSKSTSKLLSDLKKLQNPTMFEKLSMNASERQARIGAIMAELTSRGVRP